MQDLSHEGRVVADQDTGSLFHLLHRFQFVYSTAGTAGPISFCTASTNCSSWTGLVRNAAAPSLIARSRCLAPAREVTTITEMSRVLSFCRRCDISSYPLVRGISR